MMSDVTTSGDWFEDDDFDAALAHFESLNPEPTIGPSLLGGAVVTVAPATASGASRDTFWPKTPHPAAARVRVIPA